MLIFIIFKQLILISVHFGHLIIVNYINDFHKTKDNQIYSNPRVGRSRFIPWDPL